MFKIDECAKLVAALKDDLRPKTLKLAFNELKDEGAIVISRFLSRFPTLTSLDLGNVSLTLSFSRLLQFFVLIDCICFLLLPHTNSFLVNLRSRSYLSVFNHKIISYYCVTKSKWKGLISETCYSFPHMQYS